MPEMLIHLAPQCHSPWVKDVALISVEIPELSIALHEGKELRARRAYPSKDYLVASAKASRVAKDGFFVESVNKITEFHVISKWVISAGSVATSKHKFTVIDDLYDAISPDPTIWYAHDQSWESRWPDGVPTVAPIKIKPVLKLDELGLAIASQDHFLLPTLERERVLECAGSILMGNRQPSVEHVFKEIACSKAPSQTHPIATPWSCPAYVPVSELIYAAFRSNAKGLLPPNDEWRRRGL
jgi:hypothetical protein